MTALKQELPDENDIISGQNPLLQKNVRGSLTSLIQHQVILVAKLLWSTCYKNIFIPKEILQTRDLETNT